MAAKVVLIANSKGGSGKTTVATNLAAGLASRGSNIALWDLDPQKSAFEWLHARSSNKPYIGKMNGRQPTKSSAVGEHDCLIIDSAAGLDGKNLKRAVKLADKIIIPIQPSLFDLAAANHFLNAILQIKGEKESRGTVGIVGVRVDVRTKAAATLVAFLGQYRLNVLGFLRDTQLYANAAFNGLSIFDLPEYQRAREEALWEPILAWV